MNSRWKAILVPLLLAVLAASLLRYRPFSSQESGCVMEVELVSPTNGLAWFRFNTGEGWNFRDTRFFSVEESAVAKRYRVPLPFGTYRLFRILPPDGTEKHRITAARLIDAEGKVVAASTGGAFDPAIRSLQFTLEHPVRLSAPWERSWWESVFDIVVFGAFFGLIGTLLARRPGLLGKWRSRSLRAQQWAAQHPVKTLAIFATLAVAVSCHPVIFFGKSFASPNNGTTLLYEGYPTLPGAPAGPIHPYNRADVLALPLWHLPTSMVTHAAVFRDGELPLWNRYTMCGLSLLGQGMSMIGDPLYWITVAADGEAWAWDVRFLLARFLFVFGVGLVVWTSVRSLPVAALLTVSAAFIGLYTFRFNHPAVFTVNYSPWILWCWLRAAEAKTLHRAAPWALALIAADWMELNSGTAKEMAMVLVFLNGIGGMAMMFRAAPWPERVRRLLLMGASVVVFLAISAPLWLVFLRTLSLGSTIYDVPQTGQLSPGLFLGLFDELFTRQLLPNEWVVDPSVNFLVLVGVLWLITDLRRAWASPIARATLLGGLPCLAMVFGVMPPAWIDRVPFLKNIEHVDDTFISVLIVPLFVLAGFGLKSAFDTSLPERRWSFRWKVSLTLLAALFALYYGTVQARPRIAEFDLQFARATSYSSFFVAYAVALAIAAALLPWFARRFLRRELGVGFALVGALLFLGVLHFRFGMWLDTSFDNYVVNPQARSSFHGNSAAVNFIRAQQAEPGRAVGFGQVMRGGFASALLLETPAGTDAVQMKYYAEWYGAAARSLLELYYPTISPANFAATQRFYDAMNVRYYLQSPASAGHAIPGVKRVLSADLEVLESETAWPRAFFTDRVTRYDRVQTLMRWVEGSDGRPFAAVALDEKDVPALSNDQNTRRIVPARDYRLTANTTAFTIDAPSAGLAVLSEVFATGEFRARVNGQPAEILRVNHAFKGVALPGPGTYRVEIAYWPRVLTPALWVSFAGLLALLGASVIWWRAGRSADAEVVTS